MQCFLSVHRTLTPPHPLLNLPAGCVDSEGAAWVWGFGTSNQLGKGEDDEDEIVPRKLAETKRFAGQRVVALEFGGQHVAMLCQPK